MVNHKRHDSSFLNERAGQCQKCVHMRIQLAVLGAGNVATVLVSGTKMASDKLHRLPLLHADVSPGSYMPDTATGASFWTRG